MSQSELDLFFLILMYLTCHLLQAFRLSNHVNHCHSAFKKELDVFTYDKKKFELTFNLCNAETIRFMLVSLQSFSFLK